MGVQRFVNSKICTESSRSHHSVLATCRPYTVLHTCSATMYCTCIHTCALHCAKTCRGGGGGGGCWSAHVENKLISYNTGGCMSVYMHCNY